MTAQELEIAIREHGIERLELKGFFGAGCALVACAFANASGGDRSLGKKEAK